MSILTTRSADGTLVSASRAGNGPPLVVVHGIAADSGRFAGSAPPRLDEHFTVFAMDRRGRGASGDAASYAFAREAEDLAAMLEAVAVATEHEQVFVLGHSFGGLVAIDALPITARIAKLVVYEPYAPEVPAARPSPVTMQYAALAESGDRDTLTKRFLRDIVQMSEVDVARLRNHASWPSRLASAHTIPREMAAAETYRFEPARHAASTVPIRMLLGGESPAFLRDATARLHAGLPNSEVVVLGGQQHIAMDTAPELFLEALRAFFV